jgi:transcriptional regulator with XRE-family HTH domain
VFDPESFELAIRMREIRVRQGLKQAEVARRMGLNPSVTSLWERGRRLVPRSRVPALAAALGVSVNELHGQATD